MKSARILTALIALLLVMATASAGASARSQADAARAEHQRIVDFWTHERVAQAIPRDFAFDPATGKYSPVPGPPPHAGGPGGGGGNGDDGDGGDTGLVTGESWNGGGEIDGAVGKVLFQMGTSYYVCSATVIDDDNDGDDTALILTAAHCVYDESGQTFATNWVFIPDYDAAPEALSTNMDNYCPDTLYGCWTAQSMAVHENYATAGSFNDQAVLHDFAVVRVGPGGKGGGVDPELDENVSDQAYSFTETHDGGATLGVANGTSGYAFGYPAAKKYKGNDLIYCAGPIDRDPANSNDTYRFNGCEMTGGSSGGSWLIGFDPDAGSGTVMSVNSYIYTGVKAMHGPILDANTQVVYKFDDENGAVLSP